MVLCTKPPRGQILAKSSTAPGWTKYFVNAESPGLLLLYKGYLSRKLEAVIHLGNAALHQDLNKQHQFEIRCGARTWQFKARQGNDASSWFQYICHSMVLYARLEVQSECLSCSNSLLIETKACNPCTDTAVTLGCKSTGQRSQTVEKDLVLDMPEYLSHPLQELSSPNDLISPRVSLLQNTEALEPETYPRGGPQGLLQNKPRNSLRTCFIPTKLEQTSQNSDRFSGRQSTLAAA